MILQFTADFLFVVRMQAFVPVRGGIFLEVTIKIYSGWNMRFIGDDACVKNEQLGKVNLDMLIFSLMVGTLRNLISVNNIQSQIQI